MFTIFLNSLNLAKYHSSNFQLIWICFGWAEDLFKFELFSNLHKIAVSKKLPEHFIQIAQKSRNPGIFLYPPYSSPSPYFFSLYCLSISYKDRKESSLAGHLDLHADRPKA